MSKLSDRLIQLKTDNSLLQKEIAEKLQISVRTYQRYESGERSPDAELIVKMCKFFDVSADYLLGLSDN